jgi:hydrogenase maturation protease
LKTLILGLGNPLRCDDGVGNKVAQILGKEIDDSEITVIETNAVGLGLLDLLKDYQRAIIIDAIQTREGKPGQVHRLNLQDLGTLHYSPTTHDVDLATAVELGTKLGLSLPREITIFAIEVADIATFSEECTPQIERAIPRVVKLVLRELKSAY